MDVQSDLVKHFQRDINCLTEEDRTLKKKGLLSLANDFFTFQSSEEHMLLVFQHHIMKQLIKVVDDKIEKHRELVLIIFEKFLILAAKNTQLVDKDVVETIVKALIFRINTNPFLEKSEELRIVVVQLIKKFVEFFPQAFIPLLSDFTNMLTKIVADTNPESKKESSCLISDAAKHLKSHLGYHSHPILKSLVFNATHQHSKAISNVVLTDGASKCIDIVYACLKSAVFDKINDVRRTVIESLAKMINGLSLSNLKESEPKLVYLFLNGLSDESEDIRVLTTKLLEDCGLKRKELALQHGEI